MHDDYIGRQIRRANRNLFLFAILPLAAVLLLGVQHHRFLANLLQSPVAMSTAEVQAVSDPESLRRYKVSLIGDQLFATKFQKVTQTRDSNTKQITRTQVEQRFSVLTFGDRSLLVSSKELPIDVHLRGGLVPIPAEIREHVLIPLQGKNPQLAGTFLPAMLDTQEFSSGASILPVCGLLVTVLAVFLLIKCAQWSSNPAEHPIGRTLQKRGEFNILSGRIDAEVRAEAGRDSGALVTASWLLHPWLFGLKIFALGDIAWAYKLSVSRRVNFIPVGKSHYLKVGDRQGKITQMQLAEANVDAMLVKLNQRAPWVVLGFSGAIDALYRKKRPEFLAEVDKRKAALKGEPAAAAKPQAPFKKPDPVGVA